MKAPRFGFGAHVAPSGVYHSVRIEAMKQREPMWWFSLSMRVVGWGVAMLLACALAAFVAVALFLFVALAVTQAPPVDARGWAEMARITGVSVALAGFFGLIVGLAAGFYAPTTEPKNPFGSPFFRAVVAGTLKWWIVGGLLIAPGLILLSVAFEGTLMFGLLPSEPVYFVLVCGVFGFSLWRALNRALDAAKKTENR